MYLCNDREEHKFIPFSAFLGHFDFIYTLPGFWLSVPFTFLGTSCKHIHSNLTNL